MEVKVIEECGYKAALFGMGLSHGLTSGLRYKDFNGHDYIINPKSPYSRCKKVAQNLAFKDGGHNKVLEAIQVWLDVTAPRYWWQEFDTYRVGTSKQSESTIHTITKRQLTQKDFDDPIWNGFLATLNDAIAAKSFFEVKSHLPESFLQRRIISTNYKVLRNMILQRRNHKLPQWHKFIEQILSQVKHPELLPDKEDKENGK